MTEQMHDAFERLAERGRPRGADPVLEGARRGASRRRRDRRVLVSAVLAMTALVAAVLLWWPSRHSAPTSLVTSPPDATNAPLRSVDVDVPRATTDGWRPVLGVPYGPAVEQLGVDPVGGPESAALDGDILVVLDTHKGRLARYLSDGTFAGATPLPPQSSAQFVTPIAGGVVISGGGKAFVLPTGAEEWSPTSAAGPYTDGTSAFCCDGAAAVRMTDRRPETESTKGYRTKDGRRFQFHRDGATIDLQFLDPQPHTTRLDLRVDGSRATIALVSEIATDSFGNVDLLVYGDDDQGQTRAALVAVASNGDAVVTAAPSPFGATHSGTPQVLATGAGDARVIVESASGLEVWVPSPRTDPAAVPHAFDLATAIGCEHPHEEALLEGAADGEALALVGCRIGERQLGIAVYANHAAVTAAMASLTHQCGTRVVGDDWIVATDTAEASAIVSQRIGGEVPPIQNC